MGASATVSKSAPTRLVPSAEHLASWIAAVPGCHNRPANAITVPAHRLTSTQPVLVVRVGRRCRTDGYLPEYYRQVRKFGGFRSPLPTRAIIAVTHALADRHHLACWPPAGAPGSRGADYFTTRMDPDKERRRLVAKLEARMGVPSNLPPETPNIHTVTNRPASLVAGGSLAVVTLNSAYQPLFFVPKWGLYSPALAGRSGLPIVHAADATGPVIANATDADKKAPFDGRAVAPR